ncbi:MAG: alanine racemase [Candidatus Caenarcaniphilales bacterium]|nr:alanine racemase [Candidatus Caenarcaniphilales bacterium]
MASPKLLIDLDQVSKNIEKVYSKAKKQNIKLVPHIKTHQSFTITNKFIELGVKDFTVASIDMAKALLKSDLNEKIESITIAFPVDFTRTEEIEELNSKIRTNIFIVNKKSAEELVKRLKNPINCFIEVDTGYKRTGFSEDKLNEFVETLNIVKESNKLNLQGIYFHAGHTYDARSESQIKKTYFASLKIAKKFNELIKSNDLEGTIIATGDTPSASVLDDWGEIQQMHPGNFTLYDLFQNQVGSCSIDEIALCMQNTIVDKNEERQELLIHGGSVHFSKDNFEKDGKKIFGLPARLVKKNNQISWEKLDLEKNFIKSLSQEHGIIKLSEEEFKQFEIGDSIGVIPVHSCLSSQAMGEFYDNRTNEVIERI